MLKVKNLDLDQDNWRAITSHHACLACQYHRSAINDDCHQSIHRSLYNIINLSGSPLDAEGNHQCRRARIKIQVWATKMTRNCRILRNPTNLCKIIPSITSHQDFTMSINLVKLNPTIFCRPQCLPKPTILATFTGVVNFRKWFKRRALYSGSNVFVKMKFCNFKAKI